MKYFYETVETIPEGLGFKHFDPFHLKWLAAAALSMAVICLLYRHLNRSGRHKMRLTIAFLTVANEIFKMYLLISHGNYTVSYLPLHLCSINIFIVMLHALKPGLFWGNFLYAVGLPGAVSALLFATWTSLPPCSGMLWHSFTVHIMLAVYPLMIVAGGDLRPDFRRLPAVTAALAVMSIPAVIVNHFYGTNFMFINYAQEGTPFVLFEQYFGNFIFGVPVLLALMYLIMFLPWIIAGSRPVKTTV